MNSLTSKNSSSKPAFNKRPNSMTISPRRVSGPKCPSPSADFSFSLNAKHRELKAERVFIVAETADSVLAQNLFQRHKV